MLKWEEGVERRRGEEKKEEWGVRGREGRRQKKLERRRKRKEGKTDKTIEIEIFIYRAKGEWKNEKVTEGQRHLN